jgi:hypothetical protein
MFDQKTIEHLSYYVYALIDPDNNRPFYIGKGQANRVFQHVNCALLEDTINNKYDKIREIKDKNGEVKHIIIRHGLTENEAFEIEAALIDIFQYLDYDVTNIQTGHHSQLDGLMSADEIIRRYNAEELKKLSHPAIIININRQYLSTKKARSNDAIYAATKEAWVIAKRNLSKIKYVLSEYRGLVVEVFEVENWYEVRDLNGKVRWGFNGKIADQSVRDEYVNKSIARSKKKGAVNPVRYKI